MEHIILNHSEDENNICENNKYIKHDIHNKVNYLNKKCIKPWGYEMLIYQTPKIGIWFLNIKKGHQTSLHCHFNKDTQIIVLNGVLCVNLYDNKSLPLGEMCSIFCPHSTFHGLSLIHI